MAQTFFFNDSLLDPKSVPPDKLVEFIKKNISGGTSLQKTLVRLDAEHKDVVNVVVLTDEDYGPVDIYWRKRFELVECLPSAMEREDKLWQ